MRKSEFQQHTLPLRLIEQAITARINVLKAFHENYVGPSLEKELALDHEMLTASSAASVPELLELLHKDSGHSLNVSDLQTLKSYLTKLSADLMNPLAEEVKAALESVSSFAEGIATLLVPQECRSVTVDDKPNLSAQSNEMLTAIVPNRRDAANYVAKFLATVLHSESVRNEMDNESKLMSALQSLKNDLVGRAQGIMKQAKEMDANRIMPTLLSPNYFPADVIRHENFSDDLQFLKAAYESLHDVATTQYNVHHDKIVDEAKKVMTLKLTASAPIEFSSVFSIQVPNGYKTPINGHVPLKARNQSR